MGPNETQKLLHSKGNHKQNAKTSHRLGENICKWCDRQEISLQKFTNSSCSLTSKQTTQSKNKQKGLPWWCSGWESACQCRGHGFEPWSGEIPHAIEQLGPWATTTEPARLEPVRRNKRGHDSERPAHRDEEWPHLPQLEKALAQKRRPNTAKNK